LTSIWFYWHGNKQCRYIMHWTFLVPLLWDAKKQGGGGRGQLWKKGIVDFHSMLILMDLIWICRLPTIQQEVQQRKLLYMGLYLLIWGEAANLRFMPECICYIYHHVCFKIVSFLSHCFCLTFLFIGGKLEIWF